MYVYYSCDLWNYANWILSHVFFNMLLTSYFMVKEAKYVVEGWVQSSDKLSARKKKILICIYLVYLTQQIWLVILKRPLHNWKYFFPTWISRQTKINFYYIKIFMHNKLILIFQNVFPVWVAAKIYLTTNLLWPMTKQFFAPIAMPRKKPFVAPPVKDLLFLEKAKKRRQG